MSKAFILKNHIRTGLEANYEYQNGDLSKKRANFNILQSIRPLIESYQEQNPKDYHGNQLNLKYPNLKRIYAISSSIQHLTDIKEKFEPKKLKHDLKILAQSVLGNAEYSKLKKKVSKSTRRSSSLLDSIVFNDFSPAYH